MARPVSSALSLLLLLAASAPSLAQPKPEVVARGKQATALVEVTTAEGGATGSAFCIQNSGLFITNAHVVQGATDGKGGVRLVIDIGSKRQRSLRAKILRADDDLDLALLKIDPDPALTPLELGDEGQLRETVSVITFGFPFGHNPTVRGEAYPDPTVLLSRITSLRRDKGRLEGVQFDGQLNPGNSGGPVVDEAGRVIGVAVATVRGAAMNLAIPVGRLAEFLAAPGVVFDPPPLVYKDRSQPVTWTIKVQPPTPAATLPEKLSVSVTVADGISKPRTFAAQAVGGGVFKVKVTPVPRDPARMLDLDVQFPNGRTAQVQVQDSTVTVGRVRFMLSDLQMLFGGDTPRAQPRTGQPASGPILGLGKIRTRVGRKTLTLDLNEASQITVRAPDPQQVVQAVQARVEARQGTKVLATVVKVADLSGAPATRAFAVHVGGDIVVVPERRRPPVLTVPQGPGDDGMLEVRDTLDVVGSTAGAGTAIRPPGVPIGDARLGAPDEPEPEAGAPLAAQPPPRDGPQPLFRRLDGTISDVVVGGGGRYLILTLKDARKLLVFDVNAADIIKTINTPSQNIVVAAGAKALFVAYPDQRIFQRWDLETMTQHGKSVPSPIRGRLQGLAAGNDSEGPFLAAWTPDTSNSPHELVRFSFLDPNTFAVLKVGPVTSTGNAVLVSPSGGSAIFSMFNVGKIHVRASAGGGLFAIWRGDTSPSGFETLAVSKSTVTGTYDGDTFGHLAPGPDGQTVYTGIGGVVDTRGKPLRGAEVRPSTLWELTVPSPDSAYYLRIERLGGGRPPIIVRPDRNSITAWIHAAGDGSRLLKIRDLDEMRGAPDGDWLARDVFTTEKRFHLVPAANLFITIPYTNDRIVLRRLDIGKAMDALGGEYLIVTTPLSLFVESGKALEHQIEARSRKGRISYTLAKGPEGMTVSSNGKLSWRPSKDLAGGDVVTAVVTVASTSGQERFHTLKIRVD